MHSSSRRKLKRSYRKRISSRTNKMRSKRKYLKFRKMRGGGLKEIADGLRTRERNDLAEFVKDADGLEKTSILLMFETHDFDTAIGMLEKKKKHNTAALAAAAINRNAASASASAASAAASAAAAADASRKERYSSFLGPYHRAYDEALDIVKHQMKINPNTWRTTLHTHYDTPHEYAHDFAQKSFGVFNTPVKSPDSNPSWFRD